MLVNVRLIPIVFFMLLSPCSHCFAASFNCSRATSAAEEKICTNAEISELDSELGRLYMAEKKSNALLVSDQKRWLHEIRDRCESIECLKRVYVLRISEISKGDICPVTEKTIEGHWVRDGNGFFGEMAFLSTNENKVFFSWIHHRPEMSGRWDFRDCKILIDGGTSKMNFEFRPTKLENNRLHLIDEEKQHVVYKRLK